MMYVLVIIIEIIAIVILKHVLVTHKHNVLEIPVHVILISVPRMQDTVPAIRIHVHVILKLVVVIVMIAVAIEKHAIVIVMTIVQEIHVAAIVIYAVAIQKHVLAIVGDLVDVSHRNAFVIVIDVVVMVIRHVRVIRTVDVILQIACVKIGVEHVLVSTILALTRDAVEKTIPNVSVIIYVLVIQRWIHVLAIIYVNVIHR